MRFIVYGAGAVGGVIGARLFAHGHDVVLIARGAHERAIRDHGLRIESPDESVTLPIAVVDHPRHLAIESADVVLLAMKSQDTAAAVSALVPVAPPDVPIVCVQNGVANERTALRSFANVYGVCVMCPTTYLEAGVVQANAAPTTGILDCGRFPWGQDQLTKGLAAALSASTFSAEANDHIMRWKYCKLVMNLANAVEAVCGPKARQGPLSDRAKHEAKQCLRAAGIDFASEDEDKARRGDLLVRRPIDGQSRGGSSSWQSLARATGAVETDYLNGEIVLLGRLHGVATPVNAALQQLANRMARDRTPPGTVDEAQVLRLAEAAASRAGQST